MDGRILIETGSKEEIGGIKTSFNKMRRKVLEAEVQNLRNPRILTQYKM